MGHSRSMHGRHQTGCVSTTWASPIGRVARSLVGPNTAVTATPAAAARCIAPESLVTSARHWVSTPASVGRSVRPAEVDDAGDARNLGRGCRVRRAANCHAPHAVGDERRCQLGEALRRPPLGAAIRSARRQRDQRRPAVPSRILEQPLAGGSHRRRRRHTRLARAIRKPERSDELLIGRDLVRRRSARHCPRQQTAPQRRAVAPTLRNAGAGRDERRANRIGQQQRGVEIAIRQFGTEIAPAVDAADRRGALERDRLVDAADQREERCNRRPRGDDDARMRRGAADVGDRRQRHDGVAQPVRRKDDQMLHRVLRS